MKCVQCGGKLKSTRGPHKYVESGLDYVTLKNVERRVCESCGETELVLFQVDDLHQAIAHAVAEWRPKLDGTDIRFLRKYLGYSQKDFAAILGVSDETVSRWETDKMDPGGPAERLIRLIAFNKEPVTSYPVDRLPKLDTEGAKRIEMTISKSQGWESRPAA